MISNRKRSLSSALLYNGEKQENAQIVLMLARRLSGRHQQSIFVVKRFFNIRRSNGAGILVAVIEKWQLFAISQSEPLRKLLWRPCAPLVARFECDCEQNADWSLSPEIPAACNFRAVASHSHRRRRLFVCSKFLGSKGQYTSQKSFVVFTLGQSRFLSGNGTKSLGLNRL